MTEAEYILVVHKERLGIAAQQLREVIIDCSDIIDNEEFLEVSRKVSEWHMAHFAAINTKEEP